MSAIMTTKQIPAPTLIAIFVPVLIEMAALGEVTSDVADTAGTVDVGENSGSAVAVAQCGDSFAEAMISLGGGSLNVVFDGALHFGTPFSSVPQHAHSRVSKL